MESEETNAKKKRSSSSKCRKSKKRKKDDARRNEDLNSNYCDFLHKECPATRHSRNGNRHRDERGCHFLGWVVVDDLTYFFSTLLSLPCLFTQFLLCSDSDCAYAYVPLLLSCFPLMVYLIDNVKENSMINILVIGNVIFLSAYSTKYNSPYGIAAAITFAVIHFILKPIKCADFTKEIIYNFAVSIYCVVCLYTLNGKCFYGWLDLSTGSGLKMC